MRLRAFIASAAVTWVVLSLGLHAVDPPETAAPVALMVETD